MMRGAAALAAAWVVACAAPGPEAPPPQPQPVLVTGTYSNVRAQVIIDVGPDDEYRARVGTVAVPVVYDVTGECQRVSFDLPHARFTGCLGAKALVGAFRHPNGNVERVYLVRKP